MRRAISSPARAAAFCLGALLLAAPATAQEVRVPTRDLVGGDPRRPQSPATPTVDLGTAVRLTLAQSPDLHLSRLDVDAARGRLQQTRGLLDSRLLFSGSFGYTQQPITPALRSREHDKRFQLQTIAEQFTVTNTQIRASLAGQEPRDPTRCPEAIVESDPLDFAAFDQIRDPFESGLAGVGQGLGNVIIPELRNLAGGFNFADLCSGELTARRGRNRSIWEDVRDIYGVVGLDRVLTDFPQFPVELLSFGNELSETIAARARLGLERLGGVPYGELRQNVSIDARYTKPFRNGMIVGGAFNLQSTAHHFLDKPIDPSFGGFEVPNRFPSSFTLSLSSPLRRGAGQATVLANELASEHLLAARRDELLHDASRDVLRTVLAYLDLLAAEQRLALLEESAVRQTRIVELTAGQVQAGDAVGADEDRALARQAAVNTSVSQARTDVVNARIRLADAMGLQVGAIEQAPRSTGQFAQTLPSLPPATHLQGPLALRRDLRALSRMRSASAIMTAASRANLRSRFDFSVNGGLSNIYESPLFFYLPDERQPIISPDPQPTPEPGVRLATPRGFYRSLTGRWEPFVAASVSFELPFGNNSARGRLQQAQATLYNTEVQAIGLDRVTRENIVASESALRSAAEAVAAFRASIAAGERSLAATMELFEAREATLFHTLRTEEDVLNDRVELVRAIQAFYQTLARLKYEAGTLVTVDAEGMEGELLRFDPSEFLTAGGR